MIYVLFHTTVVLNVTLEIIETTRIAAHDSDVSGATVRAASPSIQRQAPPPLSQEN